MAIKKKTWVILGIILGVIIILAVIGSFLPDEEAKRLKAEKAMQEEERLYNEEHKEEHYQKGLELLKEEKSEGLIGFKRLKLEEALKMFKRVASVDETYKDTQAQIQNTTATLAKIVREKEEAEARERKEKMIADAKQMIIEAKNLSKSNNCYDMSQAIDKCKRALEVLPDSKEAKSYLLEAQIQKLRCSEGNRELEMSIQILIYKPLELNVWIKNKSNKVRHANPNNFTLVTVTNRSLSVSSKIYGLSNYFDAVDLQPGTETSGTIIFDTWDKPKKLIYSEFLGTTISREFPFE